MSEQNELTGAELIVVERAKQMTKNGYTKEHDKFINNNSELLCASVYYLAKLADRRGIFADKVLKFPENWEKDSNKAEKYDEVRLLSVVGAWCAAEIDRIQGQGG